MYLGGAEKNRGYQNCDLFWYVVLEIGVDQEFPQ